jgi:cyclopropane fatty-acyl-phospholipid synthase-like methyltransferase
VNAQPEWAVLDVGCGAGSQSRRALRRWRGRTNRAGRRARRRPAA